jgi:hypothetical protein
VTVKTFYQTRNGTSASAQLFGVSSDGSFDASDSVADLALQTGTPVFYQFHYV